MSLNGQDVLERWIKKPAGFRLANWRDKATRSTAVDLKESIEAFVCRPDVSKAKPPLLAIAASSERYNVSIQGIKLIPPISVCRKTKPRSSDQTPFSPLRRGSRHGRIPSPSKQAHLIGCNFRQRERSRAQWGWERAFPHAPLSIFKWLSLLSGCVWFCGPSDLLEGFLHGAWGSGGEGDRKMVKAMGEL